MSLEQHGLEQHGSTYTWTTFSSRYCSTMPSALLESEDAETRIWGLTVKLPWIFHCEGVNSPNSTLFKGQLYICF